MNGIGGERTGWGLRLAAVILTGVLLGRLGPFGTFDDLRTGARYAYWCGLTLLMWLQCVTALMVLSNSGAARRLRPAGTIAAAAVLGAIPTAFEVAWAEMLLRVERDLTFLDVIQIYGDVLLLALPLLFLTHWSWRRGPPEAERAPIAERGASGDWLLAKLPPQRRGKLLAINSEDHYVRVRTTGGSELVHMRFGDAVAKLGTAGAQVHRSWWVARDAVSAQRREGDRTIVLLLDGTEVPVSRSFVVGAREAGLISAS